MQRSFDPYHQWLGIPPAQQPPNHYRLLSIEVMEDDADVILHAADRQMAYLRSLQAGTQAAESQRLLNEVSRARTCLLDATQKAAYDAKLLQTVNQPPSPIRAKDAPTTSAPPANVPIRLRPPSADGGRPRPPKEIGPFDAVRGLLYRARKKMRDALGRSSLYLDRK